MVLVVFSSYSTETMQQQLKQIINSLVMTADFADQGGRVERHI